MGIVKPEQNQGPQSTQEGILGETPARTLPGSSSSLITPQLPHLPFQPRVLDQPLESEPLSLKILQSPDLLAKKVRAKEEKRKKKKKKKGQTGLSGPELENQFDTPIFQI